MLSGKSQTPWSSSRSSALRRGGSGTRRPATVTTASGSSAGWCGGTTAGQRAGRRRRCVSGRSTWPSGLCGARCGSWRAVQGSLKGAEVGCRGAGRVKGTHPAVEQPESGSRRPPSGCGDQREGCVPGAQGDGGLRLCWENTDGKDPPRARGRVGRVIPINLSGGQGR